MPRVLRAAAVAAAFLACLPAYPQGLPVVFGERALASPVETPKLRIQDKEAKRIELSPVGDDEIERVRAQNARGASARSGVAAKRLVIGVSRAAPESGLEWVGVEGGRAARLAATSPGALALRVAIDLRGVAADVEMTFFGSKSAQRLFGPYRVGEIADRMPAWWSPLTEGETLTVEFFSPRARSPGAADPRVVEVGHLFLDPAERRADKRLADIGDAGSCNVDVQCSPLDATSAFRDVMESVAQMVFVDGSSIGLCTGTLLNDSDSSTQKPWFFSANHCFDNESAPFKTPTQMQSVASTLATLWFFEANACGSATPNPSWVQLSGGATYIYNDEQSDVLFVRLNNPPPGGAYFAGWDANAVSVGASGIDIHHPEGDLKKVTQGAVFGFAKYDSTSAPNQYVELAWSSGTTEPGSSGSGFFTPSGGQYVLRGALRGGFAACSDLTGHDFFSRFDQAYPALSPYLGASGPVTPFADITSLWWVPSESGWGLNLIQSPITNIVFGTWYTYGADGKRTWFVMPSGSWSNPTTYTGTLYATSGPAFTGPFDPSLVTIVAVGTGTLSFSDANNATWTYSVNGVSGVKTVQRFRF
jgi:hypothetical protein